PITTPKLADSKGRQIPTVRAVAISAQEQEAQERDSEGEEDQVLVAIGDKLRSVAEIAYACNWLLPDGKPYRSRVDRVLKRLAQDKLVRRVRGKRSRRGTRRQEGESILRPQRHEAASDRPVCLLRQDRRCLQDRRRSPSQREAATRRSP